MSGTLNFLNHKNFERFLSYSFAHFPDGVFNKKLISYLYTNS